MWALVLAFLSGWLLATVIILGRHTFYSLARSSSGLLNALLSDLDDDDKVAAISKNLLRTLKLLGLMIVIMAGAVVATMLPYEVAFMFTGQRVEVNLFSYPLVIPFAIATIIPFYFVKKSAGGYSELSRLLHEMVLNNYYLGQKLLGWQLKKVKAEDTPFVIVSGLARSGTTALTLALHNTGAFRSLDYSNMPFLMSPRLWAKVYKPKSKKKKERKHGDKVMVGLDSVEALEEYFFKVTLNDAYILSDILVEHDIPPHTWEKYLRYQRSIAGDKIYLAKNNNLLLRFRSLRSFSNAFHAVFLFRHPAAHARSLMQQHMKFLEFQKEDPFILTYMNWLGHHEFGNGLKPFSFGDGGFKSTSTPDTINFWLEVWINYYGKLLGTREQYLLFEYDDFLRKPGAFMEALEKKLSIPVSTESIPTFDKKEDTSCTSCDATTLNKALEIYDQLQRLKVQLP